MGEFGASLIDIPTYSDSSGILGVLEDPELLGFQIQRVYFIHGVPKDGKRGGHAHKNLRQVLVALQGSVKIKLNNGSASQTFTLDNPAVGLRLSEGLWRDMFEFTNDCVCLVLASSSYDEDDYFRDYESYLEWLAGK